MSPRNLKRFLVGAAFAAVTVPSVAMAAPTCAYVLGKVDSITYATPAVAVVVPPSDASIQPIRVHLDETSQTILGYSVRVPGADAETDGTPVFLPGVAQYIPSISTTVPAVDGSQSRCVNVDGIETPAVLVKIPSSVFTLPGATAYVGGAIFNIVGTHVTAPSQLIMFDGTTIVIPEREAGIPAIPVGTPNQSIIVDINGALTRATYLPPGN